MRKIGIALATVGALLILAAGLFHIKVGGLIGRKEQVDQRIEYCFDVTTDPEGRRLFVAAGRAGLHILDLEEGHLRYHSTYYDGGYYRNLEVYQDRAYVADSDRGLVVLDISRETPVTAWVQPEGEAGGVHIKDGKAYVAAFEKGLEIGELPTTDAIWSHILLGWSYYVLDRDDQGEEKQCIRALPQFKAAWDILEELPRRELGLEYQAVQGLEACE